jgi:hypothetical protein
MRSFQSASENIRAITDDIGDMHDVPSRFWGSKKGHTSYDPDLRESWVVSFPNDDENWRSGRPFLDLGHLEKELAVESSSISNIPSPASESGGNAKRRSGGAPRKYDREAFLIEAFKLIYDGLVPATQAELRKAAIEAYYANIQIEDSGNAESLTDEWAKPLIRRFWNRLELEK